MANYATLKAAIQAAIYENGNNEITGTALQQSLLSMISSLGDGFQFMGIATPTTNPGTPDENVFYLASTAGTYTNFGGLVLADGEVAILKYDGTWTKDATGSASIEQVNQLSEEVDGIAYIKTALQSSILYNHYFTQAAPTIVPYSAGFNVHYFKVAQNGKIRITASNSDSRTINYGFTTALPTDNIGVTNPVSVNTSNINLTLESPVDGYFVVSKYQNYFTNLSVVGVEDTIENIRSIITEIPQIKSDIAYYRPTIYEDKSPIDLSQYTATRGFFDTNNIGEWVNHSSRQCILDFIPVEPLSRLVAIMQNGFSIMANFYNVASDGTWAYKGSAYSNDKHILNTNIQADVNAVRFAFYPMDDNPSVTADEVTSANYAISARVGERIVEAKTKMQIPTNNIPYVINDNDGWAQGVYNLTGIVPNRIITYKPIKVIPGHRYSIEATPSNFYTLSVIAMTSTYLNAPYVYLPNVYTKNNYTGSQWMTYVIPKGYEYIWLLIAPDDETITPDEGANMDFRIIDVTGNLMGLERSKVLAPLHTQGQVTTDYGVKYSQGMVISNGYVFVGYSTGEIEVYDYDTMAYISTFVVNRSLHLGQMIFGDVYAEGDEFGILWTDAPGYIYGYRITRSGDTFTATLVKTITAPTIAANVMQFYILDWVNKQVALCGYQTDNTGPAEINLYNVSEWEEGATFTPTDKQIVYPHFGGWPFQSGFFRDGKLYVLCGTHQQNARIYCFDFDISNIDGVIDLRREAFNIPMREEPQGLCVYDGRIILSGSYYIYELFL